MLCSIRHNEIGDKGASALAAILKETMISNLKCAPPHPECSLSCQRPLTAHSSFPWQLGQEPALRHRWVGQRLLHCRGHHQAVRGAQGERRDLAQVRRHPACFAFLSAPADTPALSLAPTLPNPSFAVSGSTASELRAPPHSPPSSRRRRSPTSSAPPPPIVFAFMSAPVDTPTLSPSHPAPRLQYRGQQHRRRGRLRARGRPQRRRRSPTSSAPPP